jgi:uncharacterized protein (DUF305 family)
MRATTLSRTTLASVVLATTVAVTGCGGDSPVVSTAAGTASATTAPAPAPSTLTEDDVLFVQMMIPHHQQAVAMAELAPTRARDPQVRELAERILSAQKPQIATMVGWMQGLNQPTAPPNESDHGPGEHTVRGSMTFGAMVRLRETSGAKFDRQFLTRMIAHHRGAVTTAKLETAAGSSPEVTALADAVITGQQAEIATMRKILARL